MKASKSTRKAPVGEPASAAKPARAAKAAKAAAAVQPAPRGRLKVTENFIFPSLVWHADFPGATGYSKKLLSEIAKWRADIPSVKKSNAMGWHSPPNMHRQAALKPLCDGILRMAATIARSMKADTRVRLVIDTLWINVNPRNAYNTLHDHPDSVLSGVYYVQGNAKSGRLRFRDPRSAKRMAPWPVAFGAKTDKRHWDRVSLSPVAGRMVMFPSWLEHEVESNQSNEDRISISFNLVFVKSPIVSTAGSSVH